MFEAIYLKIDGKLYEVVTLKEACRMLGLGESTLRAYLSNKQIIIQKFKLDNWKLFFKKSDVLEILKLIHQKTEESV